MSVIYRDVEALESINAQQRNAPNPIVALQLQKKYMELKKRIDADLDPVIRLCHPWTYVPPLYIS